MKYLTVYLVAIMLSLSFIGARADDDVTTQAPVRPDGVKVIKTDWDDHYYYRPYWQHRRYWYRRNHGWYWRHRYYHRGPGFWFDWD